MHNGVIRLIIETNNITTSVASERTGNNDARWVKQFFLSMIMTKYWLTLLCWFRWNVTRFKLGAISQPYRVGLEIAVPLNGSIAIDNIRLDDCFPESKPYDTRNNCTTDMFRCNNGSCLNRTRICDLTPDCAEGEDEILECGNFMCNYLLIFKLSWLNLTNYWFFSDKIPETARCNFEHGWCGWTNSPDTKLKWTLHRGSTPSERTGPSYDHTYRNETGKHKVVNGDLNSIPGTSVYSISEIR